MSSQVSEKFSDYYEKWMTQLEDLLRILLLTSRERNQEPGYDCDAILQKLTSHHKELYMTKWALAREDVLAFFNPVWLSPLENAHLWVTGWKPSMTFRLLDTLRKAEERQSPGGGMTEEQTRKVEALRVKIGLDEERVEREMERQQVSVADRRMVQLVRLEIQARKGGGAEAVSRVDDLVESALKGMVDGLEKVMKMADCVRLKALKGMMDVLSLRQCVQFLAAMSMLQIQMRKWGIKRESLVICNGHTYQW